MSEDGVRPEANVKVFRIDKEGKLEYVTQGKNLVLNGGLEHLVDISDGSPVPLKYVVLDGGSLAVSASNTGPAAALWIKQATATTYENEHYRVMFYLGWDQANSISEIKGLVLQPDYKTYALGGRKAFARVLFDTYITKTSSYAYIFLWDVVVGNA